MSTTFVSRPATTSAPRANRFRGGTASSSSCCSRCSSGSSCGPRSPTTRSFRSARRSREAARSKWWIFVLAGLEIIRQLSYLVQEHNEAYYQFWQRRIAGVQPQGRADQPLDAVPHRPRLQVAARARGLQRVRGVAQRRDVLQAARHAPADGRRLPVLDRRGPAVHLPARLHHVHRGGAVRRHLLVPVEGRDRGVLPRRRPHPVHRRVGPGLRARARQGEPRLPRGPRVDRGARAATCRRGSSCTDPPAPARR